MNTAKKIQTETAVESTPEQEQATWAELKERLQRAHEEHEKLTSLIDDAESPSRAERALYAWASDQFDTARAAVIGYAPLSLAELADKAAFIKPTDRNMFYDMGEQIVEALAADASRLAEASATTEQLDGELAALEREFDRRWALEREADDLGASFALLDEVNNSTKEIATLMVEHPARSLRAIQTKARAVHWCFGDIDLVGPTDGAGETTSQRFAIQIVRQILDAATAAPASVPSDSIAAMWAEAEAEMYRVGNMNNAPAGALDRFQELEMAVLSGPIRTKADMLAKLKACAVAFDFDGDVTDYRAAYVAALAWLEANA